MTHVFTDNDVDVIVTALEQKYNINSQMLEALYLFKFSKQKLFFEKYNNAIIASTGEVLRVDHTYKIASALSAMDTVNKKRVSLLHSSVYDVTCTPGSNQSLFALHSQQKGASASLQISAIR